MSRRKPLPTHIIIEWVSDCERGKNPTLPEYVRRYPEYGVEIIDFVIRYIGRENRRKRAEALQEP